MPTMLQMLKLGMDLSVQTNASLWTVIEAFKRGEAISFTKWKKDIRLMCSKNARSPHALEEEKCSTKVPAKEKQERLKHACQQCHKIQDKKIYLQMIISSIAI